jgi:hypothetical protein
VSTLKPTAAAEELNRRGVKTPSGGKWHATQVIRVRKRLKGAQESRVARVGNLERLCNVLAQKQARRLPF